MDEGEAVDRKDQNRDRQVLEKWSKRSDFSFLYVASWLFAVLGFGGLLFQIWGDQFASIVHADHPVWSTVVLVGMGLGLWYATRESTFSQAAVVLSHELHERLYEVERLQESARIASEIIDNWREQLRVNEETMLVCQAEVKRLEDLLDRYGIDPTTEQLNTPE